MSPLFRSLFRKNSPTVTTKPATSHANLVPPPPAIDGGKPASTWEGFWAARIAVDVEDAAVLQRTISDQIDWLVKVLDLIEHEDGERSKIDVGIEIRRTLNTGRINEGSINAAVAATLGKHFWPRVEGERAAFIRSKYKELTAERPTVRCGGEELDPEIGWNQPKGWLKVNPQLVEGVLIELREKHDLANEHSTARVAEIQKHILDEQAKGTEGSVAAQVVLANLDRFIGKEQSKYRANAMRGTQSRQAIWRSKAVAALCGCTGCVGRRMQTASSVSIVPRMPSEQELLHTLRTAVSEQVPRKYVDVLRLDLVVVADLVRDGSPFTCQQERSARMASVVHSLFDVDSDRPEQHYLEGLQAALSDVIPEISARVAARVISPQRRQILTWQDAEENAAGWMRFFGFKNAQITGGGSDGGIDVVADDAVAQVKRETAAVGSPAIQRLYGAASAHGDYGYKLFFSLSGYTKSAEDCARRLGIGLFIYDLAGRVEPINATASLIYRTLRPADRHDDILALF